jgi:hypothetical protein
MRPDAEIDFTDADIDAESDAEADPAAALGRLALEAEGWLQATENPRIVRLRELFNRGGRAMKAVQSGTAGRRELSELKAVRLGLTQEFESYPAELQREVRPAYNRVIAALGKVIVQLQKKIERGAAEEEEGSLESQSTRSRDSHRDRDGAGAVGGRELEQQRSAAEAQLDQTGAAHAAAPNQMAVATAAPPRGCSLSDCISVAD